MCGKEAMVCRCQVMGSLLSGRFLSFGQSKKPVTKYLAILYFPPYYLFSVNDTGGLCALTYLHPMRSQGYTAHLITVPGALGDQVI